MSSFFDKLHGRTSTAVSTTKARPPPHSPRPSPQLVKPANAGDAQKRPEPCVPNLGKGNKKDKKQTSSVGNAARLENGKSPRAKNSIPATPMRRTQSSSVILPVTKKRKTTHTTTQDDLIPREISRVASLTPSNEAKRRRTASPAYRIHRSPSDNETDFSEPVKLFRDETPDFSHQTAVERSMLNLRAGEDLRFMHAKELVCVVDKDSFVPDDPANPALEITVKLPFGEETFKLLRPKKHDEYHPTGDVVDTISHLLIYFLPNDTLPHETTSQDYIYRLSKAIKSTEPEQAIPLITPINDKVISLRPFTRVIEQMSSMPRDLLLRITMQCYTRQVSPHLDGLRKYTAFSSTVYGELLFPFLSKLFSDLKLSPGETFVDLGCGVGNCIIQAAGETGCTAIGIEIMDHAATLAIAQIAEFEARMRAWGLSHGQITFHHGDILTHPAVPAIMQQANVVLCNNYAFTAELNDTLLNLFLDLPEGAKVVSLRSFIPVGKDGRARGARGGVGEMLSVQKARFGPGSVSWMPGGGEYFISTVARTSSAYGTPRSMDA